MWIFPLSTEITFSPFTPLRPGSYLSRWTCGLSCSNSPPKYYCRADSRAGSCVFCSAIGGLVLFFFFFLLQVACLVIPFASLFPVQQLSRQSKEKQQRGKALKEEAAACCWPNIKNLNLKFNYTPEAGFAILFWYHLPSRSLESFYYFLISYFFFCYNIHWTSQCEQSR